MGRIQDQTRVEGVFPKHNVFVQCPMEKKCSGIGYCTPKGQIKCIVLRVSFLVELELLTHFVVGYNNFKCLLKNAAAS